MKSHMNLAALETILIQCIGDHRRCPHCGKAFIPVGPAENAALSFYVKHFKKKAKKP